MLARTAILVLSATVALAVNDTCSLPVDAVNAECGPGTGYRCGASSCCSKYNYCGSTSDHCGSGCQPEYGLCTGQTNPCSSSSTASSSSAPSASPIPIKCPPRKNLLAGYYAAYSGQAASSIPWSYTDMAFYFVAPSTNTASGFSIPDGQTAPSTFVSQAHKNKRLAIFTIGGWTGSMYFSQLFATTDSRQTFAKSIAAFISKNNFDGVDIDFEYPNSAGIGCNNPSANDADNMLAFLQILRSLVGSKLITAAVAPLGIIGSDGNPLTDASGFAAVLDYITLMVVDIYGPGYVDTSGPNAPLSSTCSDVKAGADVAVKYWTSIGVPACKLLLEVPSYGHGFTTLSSRLSTKKVNGISTQLYQPVSQVAPMGDATDTPSPAGKDVCGNAQQGGAYSGVWTYNNMLSGGILSKDGKTGLKGYTRYFDKCSSTPFLFNPAKKNIISYDDAISVEAKAKWAKAKGLAGLNFFAYGGFNSQVFSTARKAL